MYNEKLEELIDAALADGVLTEKEKQVLFKKAQEMGIDLDEFEMVLDSRMVKIKKSEEGKAQSSAPKSNKLGDVKKCPACGAIVQSYLGSCPECGYAFENIGANSSTQDLARKCEAISNDLNKALIGATEEAQKELVMHHPDTLANAIRTFSIPNTKADLFEFITYSQSLMMDRSTFRKVADAYLVKYREAITKAKLLFHNDPTFQKLIEEQENVETEFRRVHKKQPKRMMSAKELEDRKNTRNGVLLMLIIFAVVATLGILGGLGFLG